MRITEENYKDFVEYRHMRQYPDDVTKSTMMLDISLEDIGKEITGIDYLPKGLKVLHLGAYCSVEELPHIPDTVKIMTCSNGKLKHIPNLPKDLKYYDMRRTSLDDQIRLEYDIKGEGSGDLLLQLKEYFALKDVLNKI